MFCTGCGKEVAEGKRFCKACGLPVEVAPPTAEPVQAQQQQPRLEGTAPEASGLQPAPGEAPAATPLGAPGAPPLPPPATATHIPLPPFAQSMSPTSSRSKKPLVIGLLSLLLAGVIIGGIFIYLKVSEPSRKLSNARSKYEQADYTSSIDLCDEIVKKWPDKPQAAEAKTLRQDASLHLGEELVKEGGLGNYRAAEEIYNGLGAASYSDTKSLDKDRDELYLAWAGSYKQAYSYKEAIDKYEAAAKIQPLSDADKYSKVECLFQLGEQLKAAGKYGDAAAAYKKCNSEDDQSPLAGAAWTNFIDMKVASNTNTAPLSKDATASGQAKLIIENKTSEDLTYYISGPASASYDVPGLQSLTVYITPGYYSTIVYKNGKWILPNAEINYVSPDSTGWYYTYTVYWE